MENFTVQDVQIDGGMITARLEDEPVIAEFVQNFDNSRIYVVGQHRVMVEVTAQDLTAREDGGGAGGKIIRAPMSGRIIQLNVKVGQQVVQGETVVILEAMKMEHALKAGLDAVVKEIGAKKGDQVEEGQMLISFEAAE
jgi:geranyl-CoA carboxylase alpha subunit